MNCPSTLQNKIIPIFLCHPLYHCYHLFYLYVSIYMYISIPNISVCVKISIHDWICCWNYFWIIILDQLSIRKVEFLYLSLLIPFLMPLLYLHLSFWLILFSFSPRNIFFYFMKDGSNGLIVLCLSQYLFFFFLLISVEFMRIIFKVNLK